MPVKLHQYLGTAALILSLTSASAKQVIFKTLQHQNTIGNGQTQKTSSKGFLVVDPYSPSTNVHVALIMGFTATNGQKFFAVSSTVRYSAVRVFGSNGDAHTIITSDDGPNRLLGIVSSSICYIGRESPVTIDGTGKRNLPLKLTVTGHEILNIRLLGLTEINTITGTAVLDAQGSRASNFAEESFDAAVNRLAGKMEALGYTRFPVPE